MQTCLETWGAAEESATKGDLRSANAMRMFALANALAAAETAVLKGDGKEAVERLRQLQNFTELMMRKLLDVANACDERGNEQAA